MITILSEPDYYYPGYLYDNQVFLILTILTCCLSTQKGIRLKLHHVARNIANNNIIALKINKLTM